MRFDGLQLGRPWGGSEGFSAEREWVRRELVPMHAGRGGVLCFRDNNKYVSKRNEFPAGAECSGLFPVG